jgi:hypothetical protein
VIAYNFATGTEDTIPDGFAGMNANQIAAYLPQTPDARDLYALRLADGLTPLDAWLRVTETALGIHHLTHH